ncbi:MAG: PEGA domain-containing protein [Methanoregula sp.]|nr:PEGA domain-containing protein [Methanoregula sp.]
MKNPCSSAAILLIIGFLILTTCVSASMEITAYIGDTIPLSGNSYGSSTVYLFLTGPNLPVNGVALNDITARADEGHFTELDAGTYTVWVVNRPLDRSNLVKADYSTISIRLATPVLKVNSPVIPGTLVLNISPDNASVFIDDTYRGKTPLIIRRIDPGIYRVIISRPGYANLSAPVRVDFEKTTEVSGELTPLTGSLTVTTSPPGTRILLDTVARGETPISFSDIGVGNHTLTLVKEGYVTADHVVTVREDRTTQINISLSPASRPIPDTLRTAGSAPVHLIAGFIAILLGIRYIVRK